MSINASGESDYSTYEYDYKTYSDGIAIPDDVDAEFNSVPTDHSLFDIKAAAYNSKFGIYLQAYDYLWKYGYIDLPNCYFKYYATLQTPFGMFAPNNKYYQYSKDKINTGSYITNYAPDYYRLARDVECFPSNTDIAYFIDNIYHDVDTTNVSHALCPIIYSEELDFSLDTKFFKFSDVKATDAMSLFDSLPDSSKNYTIHSRFDIDNKNYNTDGYNFRLAFTLKYPVEHKNYYLTKYDNISSITVDQNNFLINIQYKGLLDENSGNYELDRINYLNKPVQPIPDCFSTSTISSKTNLSIDLKKIPYPYVYGCFHHVNSSSEAVFSYDSIVFDIGYAPAPTDVTYTSTSTSATVHWTNPYNYDANNYGVLIYIDGVLKNTAPITQLYYTYALSSSNGGAHTMYIKSYYPGVPIQKSKKYINSNRGVTEYTYGEVTYIYGAFNSAPTSTYSFYFNPAPILFSNTSSSIDPIILDKATLTWSYSQVYDVTATFKLVYINANGTEITVTTSSYSAVISNLALGSTVVSLYAIVPHNGARYESTPMDYTVTTVKLSSPPSGLTWYRNGVNTGRLVWNKSLNIAKYNFTYGVLTQNVTSSYDQNGVIYYYFDINSASTLVQTLPIGSSTFKVSAVYENSTNTHASDYNSVASTIVINMTRLSTPIMSVSKIYNSYGGVSGIQLSWTCLNKTWAEGFIIRDYYELWDPTTQAYIGTYYYKIIDNDVNIYTIKSLTSTNIDADEVANIGKHNYVIKAYYGEAGSSTNEYDSPYCAEDTNAKFACQTLEPVTLSWLSDTTGLAKDQSSVSWTSNPNANSYYLSTLHSGTPDIEEVLLSSDYPTRIYDITNKSNSGTDLINPTATLTYQVKMACHSYNDLYWQPSDYSAAIANYNVIKLSAPSNMVFNPETYMLTWNSVTDASIYYIYEYSQGVNVPMVPPSSNTNSYSLLSLQNNAGKHNIKVYAAKITTVEE